jgi:hypothetical protein
MVDYMAAFAYTRRITVTSRISPGLDRWGPRFPFFCSFCFHRSSCIAYSHTSPNTQHNLLGVTQLQIEHGMAWDSILWAQHGMALGMAFSFFCIAD